MFPPLFSFHSPVCDLRSIISMRGHKTGRVVMHIGVTITVEALSRMIDFFNDS